MNKIIIFNDEFWITEPKNWYYTVSEKKNRKLRLAFSRIHGSRLNGLLTEYKMDENHASYVSNRLVERMNDYLCMTNQTERNNMSELVFFTKHNTTRENMLNLLKEYSILCDKMFGVMRELLKIYDIFLDLNGMQIQEGIYSKLRCYRGV